MSDSADAQLWLQYAQENYAVAVLSRDSGLYNPCLQNAQQAVEKSLKALLAARGAGIPRTHSIRELVTGVTSRQIDPQLSEDDCDLIDSVYLPSKYPPHSVLPLNMPDDEVCDLCLALAARTIAIAAQVVAAERSG